MPHFGQDKSLENILKAIDFYIRFERITDPTMFTEDTFRHIMTIREEILDPGSYDGQTWESMADLKLIRREDSQTFLDMERIGEYYRTRGMHFLTDEEAESIRDSVRDDDCFVWRVPLEERVLYDAVMRIVKAGGRKGVRQEALISETDEMGWGRDEVLKALESLRCKACIYEHPEGTWKSVI